MSGDKIVSIKRSEYDHRKHKLPIAEGEIKLGELVTIVEDAPDFTVKAAQIFYDMVHGISVTAAQPDHKVKIVSQGMLGDADATLLVALREDAPAPSTASVVRIVTMQTPSVLQGGEAYMLPVQAMDDVKEMAEQARQRANGELAQAFADGYEIAAVTVGGNEHVLMTVWTLRPAQTPLSMTNNSYPPSSKIAFDEEVRRKK